MRKYTKMGKKQKGTASGETDTRDRVSKRGGYKTTGAKLAHDVEVAAEQEHRLALQTGE
jgi:hypothetical protein